ncbi:MAG TPA: DUF4282 domain-containing protein [Bacilli bacterium]|nr:DUF4282 domain-containing protein [Bacilli bacterium]
MQKYISFDRMITPTIIKIIFWIAIVFSVITGLGMIVSGLSSYYGSGAQVFMGIVTIVVGPLLARVYCELLIVIFKMQESLTDIRSLLEKQQNNDSF